jgi:thiamine biosynthesis lipoprotein ApbE
VARVALRNAAIATSGLSERPGHLRDTATGESTTSPWLSFTVVGPDIARVDALATICFLEGRAGMQRVDQEPGYGALAMDTEGVLTATEGFRSRTI